ncbi:ribosomal protein S18-alanine N-acetyltransferase [Lactobacillus colini]
MWKKFNNFLHPAELDLNFEELAFKVNGYLLNIMQANEAHISDVIELEREVYYGKTPWNKRAFESELSKHNTIYLVVYNGAGLVAFAGMRMQGQEGHITNIAVKPMFQRLGIGTYLLKLLTEIAYKNRAVQMTLEVRTDNRQARSVYQKFGFVPNFVRKNYYISEHADALSMIKRITDEEQEEVN